MPCICKDHQWGPIMGVLQTVTAALKVSISCTCVQVFIQEP